MRMGYLPREFPDVGELVDVAERRLLAAVIHSSDHVLRPLFPRVITRRPGLRRRQHEFTLPEKDDRNFIPRILYRRLLCKRKPGNGSIKKTKRSFNEQK